jgi:hypothetical protein
VPLRSPAVVAVAVATAFLFSAVLRPIAAAKPEKPYVVYAGAFVKPKKGEPAPPKVKTTKSFMKGLTVTVESADQVRRNEYLRSVDPGMGDLFPAQRGRPDRRLAFIVTFANSGPETVVFNPGNIALATDQGEHVFPLDQADFYMAAEQARVEDLQRVLDRTSMVLFDQSVSLRPGEGVTRIVLSKALENKWKQLQVHFSYVQIGSETHTLTFSFHKQEMEG